MAAKKPTLGKGESGPILIDVERLIRSRLLVNATSGAGKSWLLRLILEQTHGLLQHLVIDPEGDFYTLRERHDYLLIRKEGGDCAADPRSAALLATKLLELGASAVLDLYDLKRKDRIRFVRLFLESMMDAPKRLWHPVLVVVDEAQLFCPEKGKGEAESDDAVIDLCSRGRKRGFTPLIATQRLAKVRKDAAAECGNLLIGRATLPEDVKIAGQFLGRRSHAELQEIRELGDGEFFAFGPALCRGVERVQAGQVRTTHPKAGAAAPPAPPARAAVKRLLSELEDLPEEAEEEARTVAGLRKQLREVKADLGKARKGAPDPGAVAKAEERGRVAGAREGADQARTLEALADQIEAQLSERIRKAGAALVEIAAAIGRKLEPLGEVVEYDEGVPLELRRIDQVVHDFTEGQVETVAGIRESIRKEVQSRRSDGATPSVPATAKTASPRPGGNGADPGLSLGAGEIRVLKAIARGHDGVTRGSLSALVALKASTRNLYLRTLVRVGYVEARSERFYATPAGLAYLGNDFEQLPTGDALRRHWLDTLPGGESGALEIACNAWPSAAERESIGERLGLKASTRNLYIRTLARRELVTVGPDGVRAADVLFDQGAP